jgi:hypothetical protein
VLEGRLIRDQVSRRRRLGPARSFVLRDRSTFIVAAALLVLAVGARALALASYFPALLVQNTHDSAGYIAAARKGVFWTGDEPSGYPFFLRLAHGVSHALWLTIALQHVLGVLAGLLLLLALRRLEVPWGWALAPAVVLWLGADQLFLEQAPLSETLFTFFAAVAVYAAVRTVQGSRRWATVLGASAAALLVTRTVGVSAAVVLVAGAAVAVWRLRLPGRQAAVVLLSAVLLVGAYSLGTRSRSLRGSWPGKPARCGLRRGRDAAVPDRPRRHRSGSGPAGAGVLRTREPPAGEAPASAPRLSALRQVHGMDAAAGGGPGSDRSCGRNRAPALEHAADDRVRCGAGGRPHHDGGDVAVRGPSRGTARGGRGCWGLDAGGKAARRHCRAGHRWRSTANWS